MVLLTEKTSKCCCEMCIGNPQSVLHNLCCRAVLIPMWLPACAAACKTEAQAAVPGAGRPLAAVGLAKGSSGGGRQQGA